MTLYRYNGKLLRGPGGKLANSRNCCCSDCCTFLGGESITGMYGTFDDIEMVQNGASTLLEGATGECDIDQATFEVPVTLTDNLGLVETYDTIASVSLVTVDLFGNFSWLVEIPADPLNRFELQHSGSFRAGSDCIGFQSVNTPEGEPNGWDFGEFCILDNEGEPANCVTNSP